MMNKNDDRTPVRAKGTQATTPHMRAAQRINGDRKMRREREKPAGQKVVSKAEIDAWANTQRRLYHAGKLAQYKIDKLNSRGIDWNKYD